MILTLSAGHNKAAKGAEAIYKDDILTEYDIVNPLTDKVISLLAQDGIAVNKVPSVGLAKKIAYVNSLGSEIAIEFHLNSEDVPPEVRGPWGIYWGWNGKFSYKGRLWADSIRMEIANLMGVPGKLLTTQELGRKLGWIHKIWCPAVVIECFFISSPKDLDWFFTGKEDELAVAIVAGIKKALV